MNNLCRTLRREASLVWNRMRQAAALGISLNEETLTELTLYNIAVAHQYSGNIKIRIATKKEEKKHGADWEWWLVKNKKSICYRVQAKRLYSDGRYRSLYKAGAAGPYAQLDTLVAAASLCKAIPMYCFYNFEYPDAGFSASPPCAHKYRGRSYWGCTLAAANDVRSAGADDVATLRKTMRPWHLFACTQDNEDLVESGRRFISVTLGGPTANNAIELVQSQPIPAYVERLIETQRSSTFQWSDYMDEQFWTEVEEKEDIAGIALFNDLRG